MTYKETAGVSHQMNIHTLVLHDESHQRVNTFTCAGVCIVAITSWTDALETAGCVATPASGTQVSVQCTLIHICALTINCFLECLKTYLFSRSFPS